jgi:chorismate synthase
MARTARQRAASRRNLIKARKHRKAGKKKRTPLQTYKRRLKIVKGVSVGMVLGTVIAAGVHDQHLRKQKRDVDRTIKRSRKAHDKAFRDMGRRQREHAAEMRRIIREAGF